MIISYVPHRAYHLHHAPELRWFDPCKRIRRHPAGATVLCFDCLFVQVFGLVKNESSLGFDIHSRHFMTFEFGQRGATVDIPFFTVLKTWTSSVEHSMVSYACVCFECLKFLAERLAFESLNLSVLCLVEDQELVVSSLEERVAYQPSPQSIGHGLCFSAISGGRSAIGDG